MTRRHDPGVALAELEDRYAALARSIGEIGFIMQGSLTRRLSTAEATRYTEWIANDRLLRRTVEQMREVAELAREIILAAEQAESSAP